MTAAAAAGGPVAEVRVRIGEALVARVAEACALQQPGVVGLRADLGQTLLGIADSMLGSDGRRRPPEGAHATVEEGSVLVALTVATRLGNNCRDLAQTVQREVAAQVRSYTGLETVVAVTIAEVHLD